MLRVRRQSDLRCPYCLGGLPQNGAYHCGGCRTQLHPDCALELSVCPTIGCDHEPRAAGEALQRLVQDLAFAEEALAQAQTKGDRDLRLRAERAYADARAAYRAADQAAFLAHGVPLHTSFADPAPQIARPPEPEPEPESDLTLWVVFLLSVLGSSLMIPHVLIPLNVGLDPTRGTVGILLGAAVLTRWFRSARRAWIEGTPYS